MKSNNLVSAKILILSSHLELNSPLRTVALFFATSNNRLPKEPIQPAASSLKGLAAQLKGAFSSLFRPFEAAIQNQLSVSK
jgi:hypothetical protein